MGDPKGVGRRLRQARLARKCTGGELARRLGISTNYLLRVERGNPSDPKNLSVERLRIACRFLGVTSDWILGLSKEGGPKQKEQK